MAIEKIYSAKVFEDNEAQVRSYCRSFPTIFTKAIGAKLTDDQGRDFIDFLSGAGVMNYGHNNPEIKSKVVDYMMQDGLVHGLDMYTGAKHDFIETFYEVILQPRGLDYKVTFPGPTGTNAVETALKIARRATGRENVIAFTNAFHGMTQGSLALTGNRGKREGAGMALSGVTRMPFDGYMGDQMCTADLLDKMLSDSSSGVDRPAAIIVETIQAEGGLNVASFAWLRKIAKIAKKHGALFIVDDIQAGCGRTGTFFSFEPAGIKPDIVCLSKALGGMGLPMSLVLFDPEFDVLTPGQHNGTFRGHNLAFVGAKAALDLWRDPAFEQRVQETSTTLRRRLDRIAEDLRGWGAQVRGRGMMIGIAFSDPEIATEISRAAFDHQLIIETSGAKDEVLKVLAPLTISDEELEAGLDRLEMAIAEVIYAHTTRQAA